MELTYFDLRGLAETTRDMFKISKTPFTDNRLSFAFGTPNDFSTLIRPEFDKLKDGGHLAVSMQKLPILTVDGVQIAQSKTIERFVAKRLGFMGLTDIEFACIDMICEHIRDLKDMYQTFKKEKKVEEWWIKLKEMSQKLNSSIPDCILNSPCITLAHICMYLFYHQYFDDTEKVSEACNLCGKIVSMCLIVKHNEDVTKWEIDRPVTLF
jgi:hypothetical protein